MRCVVCDRKIKPVTCHNCNGTGYVEPALSWNKVPCPDCKGTGKYRLAFCRHCWRYLKIQEVKRREERYNHEI